MSFAGTQEHHAEGGLSLWHLGTGEEGAPGHSDVHPLPTELWTGRGRGRQWQQERWMRQGNPPGRAQLLPVGPTGQSPPPRGLPNTICGRQAGQSLLQGSGLQVGVRDAGICLQLRARGTGMPRKEGSCRTLCLGCLLCWCAYVQVGTAQSSTILPGWALVAGGGLKSG